MIPIHVVLLLACMAAIAATCFVVGLQPPPGPRRAPTEANPAGVGLDDLERLWEAVNVPLEIDATLVAMRVTVEVLYSVGPRVEVARGVFREITSATVTICDPASWTTYVLARSMVLEVRPCVA